MVYRFRKTVILTDKPGSYIVHVSADNRYKIYVNNKLVGIGPSRGEIFHWNFERYVDTQGTTGVFIWQGKSRVLNPGKSSFNL